MGSIVSTIRQKSAARYSIARWRGTASRSGGEPHPDYLRQYLAQHAEAVQRNRQQQQRRDLKRRIRLLEKNNVAFDLKRSAAEVRLVGRRVRYLEKNNVASAQVFIFQPIIQSHREGSGA